MNLCPCYNLRKSTAAVFSLKILNHYPHSAETLGFHIINHSASGQTVERWWKADRKCSDTLFSFHSSLISPFPALCLCIPRWHSSILSTIRLDLPPQLSISFCMQLEVQVSINELFPVLHPAEIKHTQEIIKTTSIIIIFFNWPSLLIKFLKQVWNQEWNYLSSFSI